jgi:hypothetical protein
MYYIVGIHTYLCKLLGILQKNCSNLIARLNLGRQVS